MASSLIRKVLVLGAGGNVGRSAITALLAEAFQVTGVTQESSQAILPPEVQHIKSDYSESSLREAFKGQDAVVSAVARGGIALQKTIVDAAIVAGVKVFLPSEYGVDTSVSSAPEVIPHSKAKIEILDYIKTKQDKISWTAVITGSLFDWGLNVPNFGGFNVGARTATIYDGGDIPYEATTVPQVGKVIAAALKQPELTRNQYVYVNSFTVTQNEAVKALEDALGEKFTISHSTVEKLREDGFKQLQEGSLSGVLALIASAFYGKGGLTNYSTTKGLWNEKLGVRQESLSEFVKQYVHSIK